MPNTIYNKVIVGNEVVIDLDNDTLTSSSQLVSGITAHANNGEQITGTAVVPDEYCVSGSLVGGTACSYHIPSSITSLGAYACYDKEQLQYINLEGITGSIGNYAFYHCYALTNIDISNVTSIGTYAFQSCSALTSIDISSAPTVGQYAFYSCSLVQSVILSPSLTKLDNCVFYRCLALTSIDTSHITTVNSQAFYSCSSLQSINLSNASTIGASAFYSCSALTNITVKNGVSCGSSTLQSKIATIGSKTYMVKGTTTISIYDSAAPTTVLSTIKSTSTTYTDTDTGATFTWTASGKFTITW